LFSSSNLSSIFNTHEEYVIITKPEEVKEISTAILRSRPEPILGVDCEGLAKNRPLCLLQMYFAGKSYLFDLLSVDPFVYGLKEVMQSNTIMKIFHDFCEDQSALINQYNLVCDFVFDTQIAHRVIQQAKFRSQKLANYDDNNISLALLL
jgi:exonuclease 3'-5' domain-containing protein 1